MCVGEGVFLHGDAVEDVMLYGRGAGSLPTASAVVSDVIFAATHSDIKYSTFKNTEHAAPETKFVSNFESAYYIRLSVDDRAGVLAKITGVFGKYGISIVEVAQKGKVNETDERVPLIIITHKSNENAMKNAAAKINALGIGVVESIVRVEK